MKILEVSDIHTEFHADCGIDFFKKLKRFSKQVDVLVVAGDLTTYGYLGHNIQLLCDDWKEIIYVTGNHEYYHKNFHDVHEALRLQKLLNKNFHWLNNTFVKIGKQRFIGCTLWFEENNLSKDPYNKQKLNDFNFIKNFDPEVFHYHDESRRFLETNIKSSDIVVTHHAPSFKSVPKRFEKDNINVYFANELDDLIMKAQPKFWFHGHTHDSFDYSIGKTRVICNPLGYLINDVNQGSLSNKDFKENNIIEI